MGGTDLLLALAWDTLRTLRLCHCSLCSAQGCWELGWAKLFTLTGTSSCTCICVSGCFQDRQLYQQGAAFTLDARGDCCLPWIPGNICTPAPGRLAVSPWHSSAGAGWCCVVLPSGVPVCHPGCHGPVHCLGGTSHMEYSPKVHICLRLSFQRFQILTIFWRDYPVLAGHTFLSSFPISFLFIY